MKEIKITIPVKPEPKLRPKVFKTKSGRVFTVTPGEKAHTEAIIREFIVKENFKFPREMPLKIKAAFYLPKPKGVKRLKPTVKPDLTAYLSLLLDAGNKYLWDDDAQIVKIDTSKVYGEPPRIELMIEPDL